jgi:hypothetical protein
MHKLIIEPGRADRQYWRDLWRYRELFAFLAWRDILAVGDEAELKRLLRQSALVNTLADFCALIVQPSPP